MAKKILVVDDELKIVQLVRAYLQQAGFLVNNGFYRQNRLKVAQGPLGQ